MFFKIIGMIVVGFFVFLFLIFFIGKFWLRRKLGKYFKEILEMGEAGTPIKISLVKIDDYDLSDMAREYIAELQENGFEILDWYDVPEMPHVMLLSAFCEDGFFAVIYDLPMSVHYDLHAETLAGKEIGVSNTTLGRELDYMPEMIKEFLSPDTSLADAVSRLKDLAAGPLKKFSKNDFENEFLRSYEREMEWRIKKGYSYSEVKSEAEKVGMYSEDRIIETQKIQNDHLVAQLDGYFKNKYLTDENVSALAWEEQEDYVYVVHEKSTVSDIAEYLFYNHDDLQEKYSVLQSGLLLFDKINSELIPDLKYKVLREYFEPIEAKVVLQSKSYNFPDD